MKKAIFLGIVIGACALVGCAKTVDLTPEQENVVAEYAAGELIKNSYDFKKKYVVIKNNQEMEDLTEGETETETDTLEKPSEDETTSGTAATDNSYDVAALLGITDAQVKYDSYKITDEYPDDPDAMLYFTPEEGYRFVAVKFVIKNTKTEPVVINTADKGIIFRLKINDNKAVNNYASLLLNDLTNLEGVEIGAGEEYKAVVIFMVESDVINSVKTLTFSDVNASGSAGIRLK